MKRETISRISDFLGSAIPVLLVFFVIAQAMSGIFDTDIWLHLRTGKEILRDFHIPVSDSYSFTALGQSWINHEWLFQVTIHLAYRFFSTNGLIFLQVLFIALAFLIIFLLAFRDNRHLITTIILSILVIFASSTRFNLRPDILSLMFFSLFIYQLTFNRQSRIIYLLLFWQLLWVNCHGYFFLGPVLIFIYIMSEFIKKSIPRLPGDWSSTARMDPLSFQRLVRVFFLSLLVLLLNPRFIIGAIYPLRILTDIISGHASYAFEHVQELASAISFKGNAFSGNLQFNILLLLSCLSLLFNWRKLDITHVLLLAVFVPFGLMALRNVAFLSFVCYVILILRLEDVGEAVKKKVNVELSSYKFNILVKAIVICLLISFLAKLGYKSAFRRYYDFQDYEMKSMLSDIIDFRYPKRCVDFILENNLPSNIFNDFNSGAYLIYHAYPKYKVFIDGRTELYSKDFFDNYFKIMKGDKESFDRTVEKFNINTALLNNATSNMPKHVFKMFYEHPDWQLVFFDASGVVFLKKGVKNRSLIRTLGINLEKWSPPAVDLLRLTLAKVAPDDNMARARLLDIVGLDNALMLEAEQALRILPHSDLAHFYLGKVLFNKGEFSDALRHLRFAYGYGFRNTKIKRYLAKIYFELGERKKSKRFFKEILKEKKDDKEAQEFLLNLEDVAQEK